MNEQDIGKKKNQYKLIKKENRHVEWLKEENYLPIIQE